jgi:polyribonucleotide 5'-hydroxyl-kinase
VLEVLTYYYGHSEWGRNDALADLLLSRCGSAVTRRLDETTDEGLWRGGLIVDTPGEWTDKGKTQNIVKRVRDFGSASAPRICSRVDVE